MKHGQGTFVGAGGLSLFYQCWRPDGPPRAILAIVHGIGEHSGRYLHVVSGLVPRGYAVYGFDHRGHGRSPGPRGHVDNWAEYRDDVGAFLRFVAGQEAGRPVFLLAHSMGALIGLDYLPQWQAALRGAIISAAPIEPVGVAKLGLVVVAWALSRLWPRFTMRTQLDVDAISRDPEVVRAYRADRLVHGVATARWGGEALEAVRRVRVRAWEIRLPILFIHGGADRLHSVDAVRRYLDQVASSDKTLDIYPGGYHEPHNDLNRDEVVWNIGAWLDRHTN